MTIVPCELAIKRYDLAADDSWVIQMSSYIGGKLELDLIQDGRGEPRIFKSCREAAEYLAEAI